MLQGLAARIEHAGYLHKTVITLEASAPDHRANVMLSRVQGQDRRVLQSRRDSLGWIVGGQGSIEAVVGNVVVDAQPCPSGSLVSEPDIFADVVCESEPAIRDTSEAAE
jgi:hypothetical protein